MIEEEKNWILLENKKEYRFKLRDDVEAILILPREFLMAIKSFGYN